MTKEQLKLDDALSRLDCLAGDVAVELFGVDSMHCIDGTEREPDGAVRCLLNLRTEISDLRHEFTAEPKAHNE